MLAKNLKTLRKKHKRVLLT